MYKNLIETYKQGDLCEYECLQDIIELDKSYWDNNNLQEGVNQVYGTLTPIGIDHLRDHLDINENDTFIDLGSGNGNITINFALNTDVKKATGIEYYHNRYKDSINSLIKLQSQFPDIYSKIEFINGNIYNYKIDQSIVFSNSLCFDTLLFDHIIKQLENNPNLKYFITNKIPEQTTLKLVSTVNLNCSWSKDCTFNIYSNTIL